MSPKELLQSHSGSAQGSRQGGERLELKPGMSSDEIRELEAKLSTPLPAEIRELLQFSRGYSVGRFSNIDFSGGHEFDFPAVFPKAIAVATDEMGNFWVVDVNPETGVWGPVFYACHDPPVVVLQACDLKSFIEQTIEAAQRDESGGKNKLDAICDAAREIWKSNPGLLSIEDARSGDEILRQFAARFDNNYEIADLRSCSVGIGFSWGRNGPATKVIRHSAKALFAIEKKRISFLSRLLGR